MDNPGKLIVVIGVGIAAVGVLVWLLEGAGIRLFRLPGDIAIKGNGFSFYFPIVTMLLISGVATALFWLASRWRR